MARLAIGADERKKFFVLGGLLAAIGVVVVVLYVPRGVSEDDTADTPVAPATKQAPPAAPGAKTADAPPAADAAAGGITAASLVSVQNFRQDPFQPFLKPLPPPPPPPPPPPVPLPPPVAVLPPGEVGFAGGFSGGMGLPPMSVAGRTTPPQRAMVDLPPARIPRVAIAPTAPRIVTPPGGAGAGSASPSSNKRVSGVIIGDSVRALLEITIGENTVTRVVQPGDEVDGIRVLRIERINEGGRTVTRMFIRENGEERYVDLRPAPQVREGGAAMVQP